MYKIYVRKPAVPSGYIYKLLLIMRLTTVILIVNLLQINTVLAQTITLKQDDILLKNVFQEIKKQTGYLVLYRSEQINNTKPISLDLNAVPLDKAMKVILKDQNLTFEMVDKSIIIKTKEDKKQKIDAFMNYYGIVRDPEGQPIESVSIKVSRPDQVFITNSNGEFGFMALEGSDIRISCIGFQPLEMVLNSTKFEVTLQREVTNLNEIQAIAYGSSIKRLNTATVSSIRAEEIRNQPVTNVFNALDGRIPGVKIIQTNGLSAPAIQVRGNNTFGVLGSTSSDPLYVIDGIPQASGNRYDAQNLISSVQGIGGISNAFSTLNKEDIERIDILKDADATAIYGARGANGVVLITTKKGSPGRIKLNLSLTGGAGEVESFIPMLNTAQYLTLRREAFKNQNLEPNTSNAPDLMSWDQNAYTDFQKMLLGGSAKMSTVDFSASGGTGFINFYASLNYRTNGTVISSDQHINRLGGLVNLDFKSADQKFNGLVSVNYAEENSNTGVDNVIPLIYLPPNFSLHKPDGDLNWNNNFDNPLGLLLNRYSGKNSFFSGNINLSYKPLAGLTLRTTVGYTLSRLENNRQSPAMASNPARNMQSSATFAVSPTTNFIAEPQVEYITQLGPGQLKALVGLTFSQALSENTILNGENYTYDSQLNSISGAGIVNTLYLYDQYRYASLFSRLNYDIQNKYLLSLTFRRDASSRFGPQNRFANFGSVTGAWIFSEEKLIKEQLSFLSFGKLKMSYGITGNDRIDNYLYLTNYYNNAVYDDIKTLTPSDPIANPAIKWESTRKAELNLNLGFLKDRILFNGSIYRNRSSNLLNFVPLPLQTGASYAIENLDAVVQNKGLELELNTRNIVNKVFSWSTGFNIAFERNILLSFNDFNKISGGNQTYMIGEDLNVRNRRKYRYTGIDADTGLPGFANLDGLPALGTADRYIASLGRPFYGGINNSFTYKSFTLDIFFKFERKKGPINQLTGFNNDSPVGGLMNQTTDVLNRWQQAGNSHALWPLAATDRAAFDNAYSNLRNSDFTYGNTSYIRLKTANLSYKLPISWAQKIAMRQVTISAQGLNLWTYSKNKHVLDPEFESNAYPGLRTLLLGINCSL